MTKLKITGMTCGHCEQAVTRALADIPGVTEVLKVDRTEEVAVVEGDVDIAALLAAVEEQGYSAEVF